MTTDLEVCRYEGSFRDSWNEVVSTARAQHFMFLRDYMEYHDDRFIDASWLVWRDGRPIAVLPASRHCGEVVSHGGLTFGGLISTSEFTTTRAIEALRMITEGMRSDGIRRLVYKPTPHIYHRVPAEEDLYALFNAGARLAARHVTAAIAPGPRPNYTIERQRAVRRGRDARVQVTETNEVEAFWSILSEVLLERHGAEPVHSSDEMRRLMSRFPDDIRIFVATIGDEVIAGVWIFETATVAHAQYIAASTLGRKVGALDVVFDHLLTERYADKWFDFGISNERDGSLNEGLARNKEGYGARAVVHDRHELELA